MGKRHEAWQGNFLLWKWRVIHRTVVKWQKIKVSYFFFVYKLTFFAFSGATIKSTASANISTKGESDILDIGKIT